LICGAGNSRRNTVLFIDEKYFDIVNGVLNNGRDLNKELVHAKFNAYYGLYNSSGLNVSFPKILVVKDLETERLVKADFVEEGIVDKIEEKEKLLKFNLFDGQGLISPDFAEKWSSEIGIDYIPSNFIVRASFIKGMCATFDFRRFSREVAHNSFVEDVWGKTWDINDIDIIISQSQFKLWDSYQSLEDYVENCNKNDLGWLISRYSPKFEKTSVKSNYQFLQVLNLNNEQVKSLCKKTVDFFKYAIAEKYEYSLLYLLGDYINKEIDESWLNDIQDHISKALIYNPNILNDPYVKQHIIRTLNKKIKESYLGSLILNGNYSVMISDPYAQCEHIFGLPVNGLLKRDEYFSKFWNDRFIDKVVACRAPLTWRSEVNILDLVVGNRFDDWYSYLYSGIVYNVFGEDAMIHADSDVDGDLVMTTDQKEFIDGAFGGLPVSYEKKTASKAIVFPSMLWESDIKSFNSKVGFITNVSTTMYTLLPLFEKGSKEYNEVIERLKLCRFYQGCEIDKAKGIATKPFPKSWTRWQKKTLEMSVEELGEVEFENKLLVEKRPYFMRYLYSGYGRRYKKHLDTFETICQTRLGYGLNDVLAKTENEMFDEELEIKKGYDKFNPLIDTSSVMNMISHFMEEQVKEIKVCSKNQSYDPTILMDKSIGIDKSRLLSMKKLWDEWKSIKRNRNVDDDGEHEGIKHIAKSFHLKAEKISSNANELVNLAVQLCYIDNSKSPKDFVWSVFGNELVEIIKSNSGQPYFVPTIDPNGSIEFMGKTYEMREIYD
jgi:hypothetical protein